MGNKVVNFPKLLTQVRGEAFTKSEAKTWLTQLRNNAPEDQRGELLRSIALDEERLLAINDSNWMAADIRRGLLRDEIANRLQSELRRPRITRPQQRFDIAIITALRDPELAAVLSLQQWTRMKVDDDPSTFYTSNFSSKNGTTIRAMAVSCNSMGMASAATTAAKCVLRFRPRLLGIIGIAAGISKGKQQVGDILVPDATFDYGAGKVRINRDSESFQPDGTTIELAPKLRTRLKDWAAARTSLDSIRSRWSGTVPAKPLSVHVGPLASGAAVIDSAQTVSKLTYRVRKLIGLDMEAHGAHLASREVVEPPPEFLCVKGISDFAAQKKDSWQRYAAFTASNWFREFVQDEWDDLLAE